MSRLVIKYTLHIPDTRCLDSICGHYEGDNAGVCDFKPLSCLPHR